MQRSQCRVRPGECLHLLGRATRHLFPSCRVADIIAEGKVIVEIKACRALDESHYAQVLNYLKATGMAVALLVNFGPEIDFKRCTFTP